MLEPQDLPDKEIMFSTPVIATVVVDGRKYYAEDFSHLISATDLYNKMPRKLRDTYELHREGDRYFLRAKQ